jgi:hypothetical protein
VGEGGEGAEGGGQHTSQVVAGQGETQHLLAPVCVCVCMCMMYSVSCVC